MLGAAHVALLGAAGCETQLPADAPYTEKIDATSPLGHWRLNESGGSTAADRVGTNDGTYQNTSSIEYSIDPLVLESDGGKSIGLSGSSTNTPHVTIADLVTTATFTLDIAFQADRHKAKHVLITQGLGSTDDGAVSLEVEDDGAGGLRLRQWTSDGVTAHVWTTADGTVPIGDACKITYVQEDGAGRRLYVDGVLVGTNTDLTSFAAPPAGTWYIGTWPSGADATDGLVAELAVWNSALADTEIESLAQAENVVWLSDSDVGSVTVDQTEVIDLAPLAHPASGFTPSIVTQGSLGTASVSGEDIEYAAGGTTGTDDTFTAKISRGGVDSRTATFTIDVIEAAPGIQLPAFDYQEIDDPVPAGAIWWDPTNGSDSNDGSSKEQAVQSFSAAESAASTSNRIILAGGAEGSTTYHAVGEIAPSKSGSDTDNRMELFAEPGRKVVLCRQGEFIGGLDGSWTWTEVDAGRKIYESPDLGIADGATSVTVNSGDNATGDNWIIGILEIAGKGSFGTTHLMYVPWVDVDDMANDGDGLPQDGGYGGPWLASMGDGRIRIRLTPPTEGVAGNEWPTDGIMGELIAGDGTWQEPSGTANDYRLHLMRHDGGFGGNNGYRLINLRDHEVDWWHFKGINIDLTSTPVYFKFNTGIKFENMTMFSSGSGFRRGGTTDQIEWVRCQFLTGDLRSIGWREYKNPGGYWYQHLRTALLLDHSSSGSGDLTFDRCTMFGWFDLGLPDSDDDGYHLYDHCAIFNTVDDGFYQSGYVGGSAQGELEVRYSYIFGGPIQSGGGGDPTSSVGPEFKFHHNVLDFRVPMLWRSYGADESLHGVSPNDMNPHDQSGYRAVKWYNNTYIIAANAGRDEGKGVMVNTTANGSDLPSGMAQEVYNNLLVVLGAFQYPTVSGVQDRLIRSMTCDQSTAGVHRYDYNLYHRSLDWAALEDAFVDVQDSEGTNTSNYASLAAFRSSGHKTTSESMYGSFSGAYSGAEGIDGHEEHGVEEDPQFVDLANRDYRPQSSGALSGALDLTSSGWPGTGTFEDWKGALDPNGNGDEVGPLAP